MQATAGWDWSGVAQATTIRSTADLSTAAFDRQRSAAAHPMSLGFSSGPENRRSRMPVLATIHSWEVSTRRANSSLVTTVLGT